VLQFMGEHTVESARYTSRCCEQTLRRICPVECLWRGRAVRSMDAEDVLCLSLPSMIFASLV